MTTSFRSYTVPAAATGGAIRIVPAAPRPQRIVLSPFGAGDVTIASAVEELNRLVRPEAAIPPPGAFVARFGTRLTFVVAPNQPVYAAGFVARPLSVSISEINPLGPKPLGEIPLRPSVMKTITFQAILAPVRVSPASDRWLRVVVTSTTPPVAGGQFFVSSSSQDLSTAPVFSGAFNIGGGEAFILPPGQPLLCAVTTLAGPAPFPTISFAISDALFDCCDYV